MKFQMKSILKLTILIGVVTLSACKKYGYEVEDGYDDNSGNNKSITVDTNRLFVDRSAFAKARVFPGLVGDGEPRVTDAKFTLNLNFSAQTADMLRISVAPQPQFGTGYYAPPGELIKIVVPAGADGLSVQVGGHTDNLTGVSPLLRDPIIVVKKQLFAGVNYVRNLYGGYIYINATFSYPNPIEFSISGACVTPDFELGKSNDAAWMAQVKASQVPWLELRCRSVVYLVPRDLIVEKFTSSRDPLTNPTALMTKWNEIFDEHYNAWMGLSPNAADLRDRSPQGPWRGTVDIQISGFPTAAGHSGFPFMGLLNYNGSEWFQTWVSLNQLTTNQPHPNWGTYHEFGHNCQQNTTWNWSALGESTNNLFSYKVAKAYGQDFKILHAPNEWNDVALAYAATPPSATKNFDVDLNSGRENGSFARTVPFVQLLEKFDYGLLTYIYTKARHAPRLANNDQDKKDNFYEWACEYTKTDLIQFFGAWGITVSNVSQSKIKAANYPPLAKAIWTYNIMTGTGGDGPVPVVATTIPTTAVSASSPAQDGALANLVDNNTATIYHSKYSSPTPAESLPISIVVSTGATAAPVKGISFVQRIGQSNGYVRNVEIYTSPDNVTYTLAGTTTVPQNETRYNYAFPGGTITTRYVKVIVRTGASTTFMSLSELTLFK
ncbi:hypothetical protein CA265_11160 [Sphingobacteriaceae bacterium GW460-11-11-14-LB5]|nr:hypothetical protein CA265_11160 [Sphingobacteriaceae bacterium GW460-11-11-14-LB5]